MTGFRTRLGDGMIALEDRLTPAAAFEFTLVENGAVVGSGSIGFPNGIEEYDTFVLTDEWALTYDGGTWGPMMLPPPSTYTLGDGEAIFQDDYQDGHVEKMMYMVGIEGYRPNPTGPNGEKTYDRVSVTVYPTQLFASVSKIAVVDEYGGFLADKKPAKDADVVPGKYNGIVRAAFDFSQGQGVAYNMEVTFTLGNVPKSTGLIVIPAGMTPNTARGLVLLAVQDTLRNTTATAIQTGGETGTGFVVRGPGGGKFDMTVKIEPPGAAGMLPSKPSVGANYEPKP